MSVEELSAELELERDDLAEECETRAACERKVHSYLIIVADAVSVNFSGRCKFLQI